MIIYTAFNESLEPEEVIITEESWNQSTAAEKQYYSNSVEIIEKAS